MAEKEAKQTQEPVWARLIREFERTIAGPVETAVKSDEYFDLVAQLNRARARATKTFEGISEQWLHAFNMPAASDLRRVREQLSRVERQLNKVAKNLVDSDEASEEPRRQLAQLEKQLAEIASSLGGSKTERTSRPRRRE